MQLKTIAFYSTKLINDKNNYSETEVKTVAILNAFRHWRYYLAAANFSVNIDY